MGVGLLRGKLLVAVASLALTLAVVIAYIPALRAGFVWDDDANVTNNPTLLDANGLRRIWTDPRANQQYYPLTHTSFWIQRHLSGIAPAGYHLVNVLLHALNVLLLWAVLERLGVPGAWLAAALFALHPVHVESVAWVTERKNTLSTAFFLASALAFLRFFGLPRAAATTAGAPPGTRAWRWYALAVGLFAGAVLAKTTACVLPAVLAILLWWKRDRLEAPDLLALLPPTALGVVAGLGTAWLERIHVGATGTEFALSFTEKVLVAGRAAWFYPGKILLPLNFTFIYPRWKIDPADALAWLWPAAMLAFPVLLWVLRGRLGKGPLAAALCYGILIFPALGFFDVYFMRYSFVQDHFQYLASMATLALCAAALSAIPARGKARAVGVLMLLLPLGVLTWRQCGNYQSSITLWQSVIDRNAEAWIAWNNMAGIRLREKNYVEAERLYRKAVALNPGFSEAQYNLGFLAILRRDVREATERYQKLREIDPGQAADLLGMLKVISEGPR